jgi:hypothetical protein
VKVRGPPFGDRDVQWLGPGVVVNLALLVVPAGLGPGCHVLGQNVPGISRRNRPLGGEPARVGNVVQVPLGGTTRRKMPMEMLPSRH